MSNTLKKQDKTKQEGKLDPLWVSQWLDALVDMNVERLEDLERQREEARNKEQCAHVDTVKALWSLVARQVLSHVDPLNRSYGMVSCGVVLTAYQRNAMQKKAALSSQKKGVDPWWIDEPVGYIKGFGSLISSTSDWSEDMDWSSKWARMDESEKQYTVKQLDACIQKINASVADWFALDMQGASGAIYMHTNAYLWDVLTQSEAQRENPWRQWCKKHASIWKKGPKIWSAYEDAWAHASVCTLDPQYVSQALKWCGPDVVNDCGDNVLHVCASLSGYARAQPMLLECAKEAIKAGVPVSGSSYSGQTPLHLAAAFDHPTLCALLIEHGASIYQKDDQGASVLEYANDALYRQLRSM